MIPTRRVALKSRAGFSGRDMPKKKEPAAMNAPKNVWLFEILLYASLVLDTLGVAFADRDPTPSETEQMILARTLSALAMLLLVFYLIWFAANRRKGWPRWVLSVLFALSLPSLAQAIAVQGIGVAVVVDMISAVLTAWGLYLSFTGDARDWFDA